MFKQPTQSYMQLRRHSQHYQSDKKSPGHTPTKNVKKQRVESNVSPLKYATDYKKPLQVNNSSPIKTDVCQPFTFQNRKEQQQIKQEFSVEQLLKQLKQQIEENEVIKIQLEQKNKTIQLKEQEFARMQEQQRQQKQQHNNTIYELQSQIDLLEIQLQNATESEKPMQQPNLELGLHNKLYEMEKEKVFYIQELNRLSQCLKEVLQQNADLQAAYTDKCSELEECSSYH